MIEYIELGSAPCEEKCAQVGSDNYATDSRIECDAWRRQLNRWLDATGMNVPDTFQFIVKTYQHDFGSYKEVVAKCYDEAALEVGFYVESNCPVHWDDVALDELMKARLQ